MVRPSRVEYYCNIILDHMMRVFISSIKRQIRDSDQYRESNVKTWKKWKKLKAKTITIDEPIGQSYKSLYQAVEKKNPGWSHSTFVKCLVKLVREKILLKDKKPLFNQTFYSLAAKEWKYHTKTHDYFFYPLNNSGTRWHYQVLRKGVEQYLCRFNTRPVSLPGRRMTKEEQGQEQDRIFKQMLKSPDYREQFSPKFREQFLSQHRHKENNIRKKE